ncbi:MAG TPA: AI-2E family transporter, partial [Candidatus Limnocylindria bacterium]
MTELVASLRRNRQAIFALAMILVVLWLLWTARGALPAFFIGLALAFVLDPIVTLFARQGAPRWAGVIVAYVLVVVIVWGLVAYALPPISRQAREFIEHLPELGAAVGDLERGLVDWYAGLPLPAELRAAVDAQVAASGQAVAD